ncbi:MAG: hypothetical protein MJZ67_00745 [Bacteroidales bacterium]|nr:hypothetical protein [Bacteroidales bacterium]
MTDDKLIQELKEMHYQGKVDVVDAVMQQVGNKPLLVPATHRITLGKVSIAAAACALIALSINVVALFTRDFNEVQIGSDIAAVYNFHAGYGEETGSSYSMGGVEYLFEE